VSALQELIRGHFRKIRGQARKDNGSSESGGNRTRKFWEPFGKKIRDNQEVMGALIKAVVRDSQEMMETQ
jgi:hypothetical protein